MVDNYKDQHQFGEASGGNSSNYGDEKYYSDSSESIEKELVALI